MTIMFSQKCYSFTKRNENVVGNHELSRSWRLLTVQTLDPVTENDLVM